MKSFICPYCLQKHTEADCFYRCTASTCRFNVPLDEYHRIPIKSLAICQKKCDQRFLAICPDPETQGSKVIPSRAMDQAMSLALLGERNSGKSNYIAVLVNEIKKKMSYTFNCSLMPCDDTTDARYKQFFYDPLFKGFRPLDSTSSGRQDPLLFTMDFYRHGLMGGRRIDSLLLPLYDTAGENMASEEKITKNVNYIKNAGGIILLLDPFEIEEIAEQLRANGIESPRTAVSMEEILNRIQILLQGNDTQKVIETPIAIVLTKLDLLNDYTSLVPPDSILRAESGHLAKECFSQKEFDAVNTAVKELLQSSQDSVSNLFQKLKAFKNAGFFAVSSFGCDPMVGDLRKNLKPQRVLDPILWLLAIKGYIKMGR